MMKIKIIFGIIKFIIGITILGLGVWYMSSAIGGAALTYTSMDNFMTAIGAASGDVADVNGCFMCGYVSQLFSVIGNAAEMFWDTILDNLWILLSVGFGIFIIMHSGQYIFDNMKKTAKLDGAEQKLDFKEWFDKVWRQGARVLIVGAILGAMGMGGTATIRTISNITITPVMFVGSELSMAATGAITGVSCKMPDTASKDILSPVIRPFMCTIGNLNAVMLAGAAGGFALMNYSWMGLGGGAFTWVAGLTLVLMFMIIGFHLFFQILSVIFRVLFLIIFLPIFIAAAAFEQTWSLASGLVKNAVSILVNSAIKIIAVSLKIIIIYGAVLGAADEFFPGPIDNYTAILPPLMTAESSNTDAETLSVMNVFSTCEKVSLVKGEMDADKFKDCFMQQRKKVEAKYPGAFDFLKNGWDFLMVMILVFLLYIYVIGPRVDAILNTGGDEFFDYGNWTLKLGKTLKDLPNKVLNGISKKLGNP